MSWTSSLILGVGGLTATIATIAISGIIVVVLAQLGLLTYRRLSGHKSHQ